MGTQLSKCCLPRWVQTTRDLHWLLMKPRLQDAPPPLHTHTHNTHTQHTHTQRHTETQHTHTYTKIHTRNTYVHTIHIHSTHTTHNTYTETHRDTHIPTHNTDTHIHTQGFNPRQFKFTYPKWVLHSTVFHHSTFVLFLEGERMFQAYALRFFYLFRAQYVPVSLVRDRAPHM